MACCAPWARGSFPAATLSTLGCHLCHCDVFTFELFSSLRCQAVRHLVALPAVQGPLLVRILVFAELQDLVVLLHVRKVRFTQSVRECARRSVESVQAHGLVSAVKTKHLRTDPHCDCLALPVCGQNSSLVPSHPLFDVCEGVPSQPSFGQRLHRGDVLLGSAFLRLQ